MLLNDTISLFIRAAATLDPVRFQVWEAMGITFPQLRILFRVRSRPDIDLRGLASSFGISPSAASQQVDKLVCRGLINRREDPGDRRRVCLELTELGQQAVGEISRSTRSHIETILSRLSDEDLQSLHRLFGRIVEAADGASEPGDHGLTTPQLTNWRRNHAGNPPPSSATPARDDS